MKQTAVEWQFEQFFNSFEKFNNGECTFNEYLKRNLEIRKQAKEMEKEQHKQTWLDSTAQFDNAAEMTYKKDFEQYYNETFKQQEQ
jgi:hypothetical protein